MSTHRTWDKGPSDSLTWFIFQQRSQVESFVLYAGKVHFQWRHLVLDTLKKRVDNMTLGK